ncbi:MAG: HAMP domain-containing histidine kinase [Paludibacteraceae bacterium]|nr:HAMP domain-containing histidine kinase [Paludibacteraceae bacterium]
MNFSDISNSSLLSDHRLRWLVLMFLLALGLAGGANYAYYRCPLDNAGVDVFTKELHRREAVANTMLDYVVGSVAKGGLNSVMHDMYLYGESEKNDIAIFIVKGDSLCYWSSNSVDLRSAGEIPFSPLFFSITHNSYCIGVQRADAQFRYVAFVKFRQKSFAGLSVGVNPFVKGFNLPSNTQIVDRSTPGVVEIKSERGTYLFSLQINSKYVNNNLYLWLTIAFSVMTLFLLFLINYALANKLKNNLVQKRVVGCFATASVLFVSLLAFVGWPESLFSNAFFSHKYYTSAFAASLGHLVVYTANVFLFVYVLRKFFLPVRVEWIGQIPKWGRVLMAQLLAALVFLAAYLLTVHLVYNSAIDVATSFVQDISLISVLGLFLIIPWFYFTFYVAGLLAYAYASKADAHDVFYPRAVITVLGLVLAVVCGGAAAHFIAWGGFTLASILMESNCIYNRKRTLFYVVVLAFIIINVTVSVCYIHCIDRNSERYANLAEKLTDNRELLHSAEDETFMLDNGNLIMKDKTFRRLMTDSSLSRVENVERYLLDAYFSGIGNKYEFDVQVHPVGQPFMVRSSDFENSIRCQPSFFFRSCASVSDSKLLFLCLRPDLPLAYACVFPYKNNVAYVFLYPRLFVYRKDLDVDVPTPFHSSYSYSDYTDVSVAKYYNYEILFVEGKYHYPNTSSWIPNVNKRNFHIYKNDCTHYVSRISDQDGYIVVTKMERRSYNYFIFVSYLSAIFAFVVLVYSLYWWMMRRRRRASGSILTRMQFWLLGPLFSAFVILAVISMFFFTDQYRNKSITTMSEQANSIERDLQQKIGFSSSLHNVDYKRLSQDLKDLSNLFSTDILLYDAAGRQVASSRTTIINERYRFDRLMYPIPIFTRQADYFREAKFGPYQFFSYYTYLYNQRHQLVGYVNVRSFSSAEQMRNEVFNMLVVLIDVYMVIVLLTIIITWVISRMMVKPVELLADQFKRIKLTGSNTKVEYADNDELGTLVQQYNIMVDKLQLSAEQLAQSQRELAWRDMARRIAHEIKNPLTPMKLSVQMAQMKQQRDPDNFAEYFDRTSKLLIEQIDNLSRIASEFSTFAKTTVTVREQVDLAAKVRSVVALFENNPEGVRFELDMHGIEEAMVWSDNKQILQVFNNLFRNAIQAIPDGVEGLVRVDFQINDEATIISIADNGCGIPEENLQTIFQPNFTTKTSGMGLGLSIVKTIVNLANGEIWVDSKVGVGTTFFIRIPLVKPGEKAEDVQPTVAQS